MLKEQFKEFEVLYEANKITERRLFLMIKHLQQNIAVTPLEQSYQREITLIGSVTYYDGDDVFISASLRSQ